MSKHSDEAREIFQNIEPSGDEQEQEELADALREYLSWLSTNEK